MAAAEGVLAETAGERGEFMYSLTAMGKLLQTGAPQPSLACGVKHMCEPPMWAAWSKLPEATFAGGDDSPISYFFTSPTLQRPGSSRRRVPIPLGLTPSQIQGSISPLRAGPIWVLRLDPGSLSRNMLSQRSRPGCPMCLILLQ